MKKKIDILGNLWQEIIDPLFFAAEINEEDKPFLKQTIMNLIFSQLTKVIMETIDENQGKLLVENLNRAKTIEGKTSLLKEALEKSEKVKAAIEVYLQTDFKKFLQNLIAQFMEKATAEQKHKLQILLNK